MDQFLYLSASLKNAKLKVELKNPPTFQAYQQLFNFSHLIAASLYSYFPIDYVKLKATVPRVSSFTGLAEAVKQFSPSKIVQLSQPALTLQLPRPTEESEVKKWKEKQRSLEEIATSAFLHCLFVQVYPQKFTLEGSPEKKEVRITANLPQWKVVKKVNCTAAEDKEVFAAMAAIYHAIHVKLPVFEPSLKPLPPVRKSYSTLAVNLATLQLPTDELQAEWLVFEAFNAAGFSPVPSMETIGGLYPELKVPKPRGNFGKKK